MKRYKKQLSDASLFLEGAAAAIGIDQNYDKGYHTILESDINDDQYFLEQDWQTIGEDWNAVGSDFRKAIQKYKQALHEQNTNYLARQ